MKDKMTRAFLKVSSFLLVFLFVGGLIKVLIINNSVDEIYNSVWFLHPLTALFIFFLIKVINFLGFKVSNTIIPLPKILSNIFIYLVLPPFLIFYLSGINRLYSLEHNLLVPVRVQLFKKHTKRTVYKIYFENKFTKMLFSAPSDCDADFNVNIIYSVKLNRGLLGGRYRPGTINDCSELASFINKL